MGNNQPKQKPAGTEKDEVRENEHINEHGKKEDTSSIFLEPDEDGTLQTPEEYAKDKGKILGDEDEK